MELFNEVKNRYFGLVFKIINECAHGKSKREILKIIEHGEFAQRVIGKNQQSFSDIMLNTSRTDQNLNLLKEVDEIFYPAIKNSGEPPLPVRFTNLEKAWLKALLERDEVGMVIKEETREKLTKALGGFDTPIRKEYFEYTNVINLPPIMDTEAYVKNFRIILQALLDEKAIRYSNTDKNGNIHKNHISLPVSLEYSMRDGRFRVSMYSIDDKRPVMANIFTLSDLEISQEDVGISREEAKNLLYVQKYSEEPLILEVTDKKGAMERCFMCFSGMDRTARSLGDNKYEVQFRYYLFEEENLIRNIISLGPFVKVISPKKIADEIIKRVKRSLELYEIE